MNHGRLRSWALFASLLATKAAHAQAAAASATSAAANADDDSKGAATASAQPPKAEAKTTVPDDKGAETSAPAHEPTPPAPAMVAVTNRWNASIYGFIELDGIHDSTQSF